MLYIQFNVEPIQGYRNLDSGGNSDCNRQPADHWLLTSRHSKAGRVASDR